MLARTPEHTRAASLIAGLLAGAGLAVAFAAEWGWGLVPCALCLLERWPYRIAIGLAVVGLVFRLRPALWLFVLAALAAAALGFVHVGVEQGFWPSPLPECAAPHLATGSIAERLASMPATPSKPCDEPTYLFDWLPLSMAALNMLYALALAAGLAIWLARADSPSGVSARR